MEGEVDAANVGGHNISRHEWHMQKVMANTDKCRAVAGDDGDDDGDDDGNDEDDSDGDDGDDGDGDDGEDVAATL